MSGDDSIATDLPASKSIQTIAWEEEGPDGETFRDEVHVWTPEAAAIPDLTLYTDSDWAGDLGSRKSTLSAVVVSAGAAVAAKSRKSKLVCLSSCEAEMDAATLGMRLALDLSGLQHQLRNPPATWAAHFPSQPISMHIDNQAAIASITSGIRGRNRHFDIRLAFMRLSIDQERFCIHYISSDKNLADGGTKALDRTKQAISAARLLGFNHSPQSQD